MNLSRSLDTSCCFFKLRSPGDFNEQPEPGTTTIASCTWTAAAAAAKSLQSWPTLFDPLDGSPPGSPVPGILQTRTLEWVAISFSNAGKWKVKVKSLSRVRLLATPWAAAYQAPPSMGFSVLEWGAIAFSLAYKASIWAGLGRVACPCTTQCQERCLEDEDSNHLKALCQF